MTTGWRTVAASREPPSGTRGERAPLTHRRAQAARRAPWTRRGRCCHGGGSPTVEGCPMRGEGNHTRETGFEATRLDDTELRRPLLLHVVRPSRDPPPPPPSSSYFTLVICFPALAGGRNVHFRCVLRVLASNPSPVLVVRGRSARLVSPFGASVEPLLCLTEQASSLAPR